DQRVGRTLTSNSGGTLKTALFLRMSVSTVSYTIQRQLETGRNSCRKRSGRPKVTTQLEDKFLSLTSWRDRYLTAQQLQAQLNSGRKKHVSVSTAKRRFCAAGLTGRVAVRKPFLKGQSRAWKHRLWTTADWTNLISLLLLI
uniref:Transposase Tc1-like domain-containing protein n=1 Tax=Erpetoichthys calabaricus TaxID=27687 RepID=A0A8C4RMC3_ERPCA